MAGCCTRWLDHIPDLLGLSESFPDRFPYLLESAARGGLGGQSLLLFASGDALVSDPKRGLLGPGYGHSFFERLDSWHREEKAVERATTAPGVSDLPFRGGWFIYLGYEIAGEIESRLKLPVNETGLPDAVAHRCPGAVIVFHAMEDGQSERALAVAESQQQLDEILACLQSPNVQPPRFGESCTQLLREVIEEDPTLFEESVQRIHDYLLAGDVFQVNISRPWHGTFFTEPDPFRLYEALRYTNPAPFAGLMRWRDHVLLSSSPERLVQTLGRKVQTRPIAGTRPRGRDAAHDRALSDELISNLKERAEHAMLIDLERNDLGRVCRPGTVEVNELMVVETYAHVHHIVSNVRGELRSNISPVDIIKAVFPGGTITGCPKVHCMEIIAELEGEGRGFYTGSMGYLDKDGNMDLNILIRSMLVHGNRFSFRTGAGIVADSVSEQEVLETADKARGMLLAVESHGKELKHA